MISYIILFIVIGFIIGIAVKEKIYAIGLIFIITMSWFLIYGQWAFASLIELLVGYVIAINMENNHY